MRLLGSKLHETFPIVNVDGNRCEAHERSTFNITQAYLLKWGQHRSKGVLFKFKLGLILRELIPTPLSPLTSLN